MERKFPGKILLFGEFTVIEGGHAFAIPSVKYYAEWRLQSFIDERLQSIIKHLSQLDFLDTQKFEQDIGNGWYVESNIPIGASLGSSGALSAAILYKYGKVENESDINEIRSKGRLIEDYFHGKSSGLEPLISYHQKGIIVNGNKLSTIEINSALKESLTSIYLFDSKISRGKFLPIDWFLNQYKEIEFKKMADRLNTFNQTIIQAIMDSESILLKECFKEISALQYIHFKPLITPSISDLWKYGLDSDEYYMKVSGKGAGGYYLVYVNKHKSNVLNAYALESIF